MPLLEIANANAKPSFQHPLCSIRTQKRFHCKIASITFTFGYEQRVPCAWKSLDKIKKFKLNVGCVELRRVRFMIKAIATLEPNRLAAASEDKCMTSKDSEVGLNSSPLLALHESSTEESKEPDEKEKLRRMRISKANKGGTSWNKGKKHSPETLQKIRERTRLAMQNPKVKMKLANFGHAQTAETRLKIGAGVKKGWEMKRKKKMVQEACYFEWQNLIAEASRHGYVGEEELQWNSYKIADEQLKREWQESIDQRKTVPKVQGSRYAPKSLEQRRKIAEAISSKWADPEYRERVRSAMAKYHGTEVGAERKPRRPSDGIQSTRNRIKKRSTDTIISLGGKTKILTQMTRSKSPVYKDPLVSSKLERIKNIRAQRAAAETKQTQAIERARSLIAEAEKAAKVLEVAATKSPIAQASLIETRKLIAEAIQSLESIKTQQITESNDSSMASSEVDEEKGAAFEVLNQSDIGQVNGHKTLLASDYKFSNDFPGISVQNFLNGDPKKLRLTTTNSCTSSSLGFDSWISESGSMNEPTEALQDQSIKYKADSYPTLEGQSLEADTPSRSRTLTKKWVRGRLVEVEEETQ